jgi:kynurenine formamidase
MKIIDLSLDAQDGVPVPPSVPQTVTFKTSFRSPTHWQATWLNISAHTASHCDSALHVLGRKPSIDRLPLDRFIGEAVMLDLTHKGKKNAEITLEDVRPYDRIVRPKDIIVMRTDWGRKMFGKPEYYSESPYLNVEVARWLVSKRPKAIAFDFFEEYNARLKDFKPRDFVVHRIMLGAGIYLIEGLTNLHLIKKRRFMLHAAPIKLTKVEAAPARIYAVV